MQRKHVLYLFAILALLVAMVPFGAAAQPAAPNAATDSVGNEQLPTAARRQAHPKTAPQPPQPRPLTRRRSSSTTAR